MAVPTRSRAAAAPAHSAAAPATGFLSGAAARQRSQEIASEQTQNSVRRSTGADMEAFNRSRIFLKSGEEADLIILDHTLDECLFADEHSWQVDTGRKYNDGNPIKEMKHEFCPKQHDNCPLCNAPGVNASGYTLYLTVLDLRGFQPRDAEFIPWVKRAMAVKSNLHGEFFKLHDIAMREHGTMRGMQILMARDTDARSNSTGKPVQGNDGSMFSMVSEEDLMREFGHPAVHNEEGVQVKAENFDVTPFAYRTMFVQPTGPDLARRYNLQGTAISTENDQRWNSAGNTAPGAPPANLPPRSRSRSTVAAAPAAMPATTRARTAPTAAVPAVEQPLYPGADEDRAAIEGDGTTVEDEVPDAPQGTRDTPVSAAQMPPRTRARPAAAAPAPAAAAPAVARARSAPAPAAARPRTAPTAAAAAPAAAPQATSRVMRRATNASVPSALDSEIPF